MRSLRLSIVTALLCLFTASLVQAQQSTTGPVPPPGIDMGLRPATKDQVVIPGVPTYIWHHGCGPTALGMVIGYWDTHGYSSLVPGDASTQTIEADAMMADDSESPVCGGPAFDHYQDYSCPIDNSGTGLISDRSETGATHVDNCVADFMRTSRSAIGNYYGWSWLSDVPDAFTLYADMVAPALNPYADSRWYYSISFEEYQAQIDAGYPVVLLVDTDGNGGTDHFITGIGYNDATGEYACYNTWDTQVHWFEWRPMEAGSTWGIYSVVVFDPDYVPQPPVIDSTVPAPFASDVPGDGYILAFFDIPLDGATVNASTVFVFGELSGRNNAVIGYDGIEKVYIVPDGSFAPGEMVTTVLTSGITSNEGASFGTSYSWSFQAAVDSGTQRFLEPAIYPASTGPRDIAVGDLDGDGDCDAVLTDVDDYAVTMFNAGDGSFSYGSEYKVGDGPHGIVLADFDADGDLDVATGDAYSDSVSVRMNSGDGTMGALATYKVGHGPENLVAADLNGDGFADIVTANYFTDSVSVILNTGDGSFGAYTDCHAVANCQSMIAADFDLDGDVDVAAAGYRWLAVLENDGLGNLSPDTMYYWPIEETGMVAADLDNDGDVDIASIGSIGESPGPYTWVVMVASNDTGIFTPRHTFWSNMGYRPEAAADFDNDGNLDLVLIGDSLCVAHGNGDLTFDDNVYYISDPGHKSAETADLDGDGDIDVVCAEFSDDYLEVILNGSCCARRGDVNHDGGTMIDIADLVYLTDYMFAGGPEPECMIEADIDGNGSELIDIADLVYLVDYMFTGGPQPPPCT